MAPYSHYNSSGFERLTEYNPEYSISQDIRDSDIEKFRMVQKEITMNSNNFRLRRLLEKLGSLPQENILFQNLVKYTLYGETNIFKSSVYWIIPFAGGYLQEDETAFLTFMISSKGLRIAADRNCDLSDREDCKNTIHNTLEFLSGNLESNLEYIGCELISEDLAADCILDTDMLKEGIENIKKNPIYIPYEDVIDIKINNWEE